MPAASGQEKGKLMSASHSDTQRLDNGYIRKTMRQPLLERDYEVALAKRWRDEDDTAALQELVMAYARLVVSAASKYRHYGLPLSDLIQEGNIGLMQAAGRFDPDREVRFSTYAAWWVRASIQDHILRNWSIVRTGTTAAHKSLFFKLRRLRARIGEAEGGPLSEAGRSEIAQTIGVTVRDVEVMEQRLSGHDSSLNAPMRAETDSEMQDFLADDRPNPEMVVTQSHDSQVLSRQLDAALGELSARERLIILQRRLRDEGATLEQLGQKLGVSKERVRQLEHRALKKLRKSLEAQTGNPLDLLPHTA